MHFREYLRHPRKPGMDAAAVPVASPASPANSCSIRSASLVIPFARKRAAARRSGERRRSLHYFHYAKPAACFEIEGRAILHSGGACAALAAAFQQYLDAYVNGHKEAPAARL